MKTIIHIFIACFFTVSVVNGQQVGELAPDFTLTSTSDTEFSLSEQRGNVVVVFILGYNCPFCISFAPTSDSEINQKYISRDDFVMVGIDSWNGSKSGVQSFRNKTGVGYTLLMNGGDMAKTYETTYDRLLVIDKEGILRHSNPNTVAKNDVNAVVTVVEEYLADEVVTSLGNADNKGWSFYPNPVQDQLIIQNDANENFKNTEVMLFDVTGKKVVHQQGLVPSAEIVVDVSGLPRGVYYLQYLRGNFLEIRKVIKE